MLRLMLLRHAEAGAKEPQIADRERPLGDRGLAAAPLMGRYARAQGLTPERILTSPARRAHETAKLFASNLARTVPIEPVEALYDFGDDQLLDAVRRHGDEARALMLVAHNPSITSLARKLVRSGDMEMIAEMQRGFPTAALAVIEFATPGWPELRPSTGELMVFVTPQSVQDQGASG